MFYALRECCDTQEFLEFGDLLLGGEEAHALVREPLVVARLRVEKVASYHTVLENESRLGMDRISIWAVIQPFSKSKKNS